MAGRGRPGGLCPPGPPTKGTAFGIHPVWVREGAYSALGIGTVGPLPNPDKTGSKGSALSGVPRGRAPWPFSPTSTGRSWDSLLDVVPNSSVRRVVSIGG